MVCAHKKILTQKEVESAIAFGLCSGAKAAAKMMNLSTNTVEYYWRQLRLKLWANDTFSAVQKAKSLGLLN